jgi:hypothetical protein
MDHLILIVFGPPGKKTGGGHLSIPMMALTFFGCAHIFLDDEGRE